MLQNSFLLIHFFSILPWKTTFTWDFPLKQFYMDFSFQWKKKRKERNKRDEYVWKMTTYRTGNWNNSRLLVIVMLETHLKQSWIQLLLDNCVFKKGLYSVLSFSKCLCSQFHTACLQSTQHVSLSWSQAPFPINFLVC